MNKSCIFGGAQQLLRKIGLNVTRASNTLSHKRGFYLRKYRIDLVFDVGANIGQYGRMLRKAGYIGRICSFEPIKPAYEVLLRVSKNDPAWDCYNVALGRNNGEININVSRDLVSSSPLSASEDYTKVIPNGICVDHEVVSMKQLDSISGDIMRPTERAHLKMDVQGYEMEVLLGATNTLKHVYSIESEMSFVSLYEGQPLMADLIQYLDSKEFELVWLERLFINPRSGHLWQVEGLFLRRQK